MSLQRTYKAAPIVMMLLGLAAFALAMIVDRWVSERLVELVPRAAPSAARARGPGTPTASEVNTGDDVDSGIVVQAPANEEHAAGKRKPKRRHRPSASTRDGDGDADVRARSETEFSIRRSFLTRVFADPMHSLRSARVFPVSVEGQPSGLLLQGLGPKHVLRSLGLQNGDVLRSINGHSIATPDSALDAYAQLRGGSQFALLVLRANRIVRFDYTIIESE